MIARGTVMIKTITDPELCFHRLFSSTVVLQKDNDYQHVDDSELKSKVSPHVPLRFSLEGPFPPCCPWKAAEGAAPGQRWGRSPDCWSHLPPESGHTPSPPTQGWGREDRRDMKGEVGGGSNNWVKHQACLQHWVLLCMNTVYFYLPS